jgi:predicted nucleic acid-binding protein
MSVWTVNETIAAIDKKAYKRREITPEQANKSIGKLLFDISRYSKNTRIQIVPLERDIIKGSSILIHTLHLSADDALHVFTAFAYDCQYIISDDETIKQRADNEIPLYAYSSGLRHMQVLSTTDREQIEKLFKI